jgi:hypothetical protein
VLVAEEVSKCCGPQTFVKHGDCGISRVYDYLRCLLLADFEAHRRRSFPFAVVVAAKLDFLAVLIAKHLP